MALGIIISQYLQISFTRKKEINMLTAFKMHICQVMSQYTDEYLTFSPQPQLMFLLCSSLVNAKANFDYTVELIINNIYRFANTNQILMIVDYASNIHLTHMGQWDTMDCNVVQMIKMIIIESPALVDCHYLDTYKLSKYNVHAKCNSDGFS
jgi:hypothetical protein